MFSLAKLLCFSLLIALPSYDRLRGNFVFADDPLEDEIKADDEDAADEEAERKAAEEVKQEAKEQREAEEEELWERKPSTDVNTFLKITEPLDNEEFPVGKIAKFLIGFANDAKKNMIVETVFGSMRYPQDFTYIMQNFSVIQPNRLVEPGRHAAFEYQFTPNEAFSNRPFGLIVEVHYRDEDGKQFSEAIFNKTTNFIELDEGLDGETFFLYVFLVALVVLLLVGVQQFVLKKSRRSAKPIEMGTASKGDVDFDWIPKATLNELNKSPGRRTPKQSSPKQKQTSPKQRNKRRAD